MSIQPQAICGGLTFWPIPKTTDAECAFGLDASAYFNRHDLPEIPRSFENKVESLFFSGGKLDGLADGVDQQQAMRRMRAMLSSFAPSHESKIATAAYALWVWSTPEVIKVAA